MYWLRSASASLSRCATNRAKFGGGVAADATMVKMQKEAGLQSFFMVCLIGWLVFAVAGSVYAGEKHFPVWTAIPVIAAFLAEFVFYLVPGFESVRSALIRRFPKRQLALLLMASGLLPYFLYSIPAGTFHWQQIAWLAGITAVLSFWFVVLSASVAADLGFLAMLIVVSLAKPFKQIYLSPLPHVHLDVLGHLMIIRLGASALLLLRRFAGLRYGFIPSRKESLVGLRFYLYFLPVGVPLGWWLGILTFSGQSRPVWQGIGIFFGILWVTALSEEFVFRGILQQRMERLTGNVGAALVTASVCFGLCHLWFSVFPNWRMAVFATVAGLFWGQAFRMGGVRASMVSHALVVTTWQMWLR